MQRFFALWGMITALVLTIGVGKAIWWPSQDPISNDAEAAVSDDETVSPREALMRGIIGLRATLPRAVNDQTKLVAVGLEGKIYWSRFVLDVDADDMTDKTRKTILHDAVADVCKRLRSPMHANLISAYQADYVDRKRNPIQTIEITKIDCS